MKRIEAIIRPHKQPSVLAALARVGVTNVTVLETMGLARHVSHSRVYEPANHDRETETGLIPKRLLILFVEDDRVQAILDIIQPIAFVGEPGDGIIAVSTLDQVLRVRAREQPDKPN